MLLRPLFVYIRPTHLELLWSTSDDLNDKRMAEVHQLSPGVFLTCIRWAFVAYAQHSFLIRWAFVLYAMRTLRNRFWPRSWAYDDAYLDFAKKRKNQYARHTLALYATM